METGTMIGCGSHPPLSHGMECTLNLFTILPRQNHGPDPERLNTLDSQVNFNKMLLNANVCSDSNQFLESMDTSFYCNRDYIRATMMKQEQIFKQQVCKLHELYRVQKKLMAKVASKEARLHSIRYMIPGENPDTANRFWSSTSTSETSNSSYTTIRYNSADPLSSENSFLRLYNTNSGPSSRELSICSQDPSRNQMDYDPEQPAVDGATIRNSKAYMLPKHLKGKTGIEGLEWTSDGENDIDLTLSIGQGGLGKRKSMDCLPINCNLGDSVPHSTKLQLISNLPVRRDGSDELEPPSHLQSLNLNMT